MVDPATGRNITSAAAVKPLVWGKTSYGTPEAISVVGVYRISTGWNGGWSVTIKQDVLLDTDGRSNFGTIEAAKAAAQAHFETAIRSAVEAQAPQPDREAVRHQDRIAAWMLECFGPKITADKVERVDRFIEEALELAQSTGWSEDRATALVQYVFSRPVGEIGQEVGGVMVTLGALCNVFGIDIRSEATREIDRITQPDIVLKIRAKQAAKPTGSALPVALKPTSSALVVTDQMVDSALAAQPRNSPVSYFLNPNGYLKPEEVRELMRAAITASISVGLRDQAGMRHDTRK